MTINSKRKSGRKRTGSIRKTRTGLWQAIVTLSDGSQKRLPPGGLPAGTSEAKAREFAAYWAEKTEGLAPVVSAAKTQDAVVRRSTDQWVETWFRERENRGLTSARENRSHWEHHLREHLGEKHPSDWTRDDLRALCLALDEKARSGAISPKSALNIWGTATRMCDDAFRHKDPAIRCREDNPARDVRGPDRGVTKSKEFLYPSEFLKVVQCARVPLEWRRLVAFATYTYMRDGELKALRWEDVSLDNRSIHVHRSYERISGTIKSTKGRASRRVPIDRNLLPLVFAMHREAGGKGLVFNLSNAGRLAEQLRTYLDKAGVKRAALFTAEATRSRLKFHDLRGTGLTWLAVQGVDGQRIQQWAGHAQFSTTQSYIATADSLGREGFGEPFPELPSELQSCASKLRSGSNTMKIVDATGLEPVAPAV